MAAQKAPLIFSPSDLTKGDGTTSILYSVTVTLLIMCVMYTHEHGTPGIQRDNRVDWGGSGIADIGQFLPGHFKLIRKRAGHDAGKHDTEQPVDENDDTDKVVCTVLKGESYLWNMDF